MKQKKQHPSHTKPIMEELEPRQLFSGGLECLIVENQLLDGGIHSDINAGTNQTPTSENDAQNNEAVATERKELVFIDTDVENYQQLLNDILAQGDEDRNIEVILLDNDRNGIDQISETLANYDNLDAVHLISHGSEGSVELGNTYLNTESLNQNLLAISDWAEAFSENGDFLIYGCNLAATEDGQSLVDALSQLTQTDVAASDDLTGQAELGGDWELEYTAGTIESDIAISVATQLSWNNTLDTTSGLLGHWTFDTNASDSSGNNYTGTLTNGAAIDTTPATNKVGDGKLSLSSATDDYVNLDAHISNFSGLNEGTISAWINLTDTNENTIFGLSDKGDTSHLVKFGIESDGTLKWFNFNDANNNLVMYSTQTIDDGLWHHVAVTVDASGGTTLYIDGQVDGTSANNSFFNDIVDIDAMDIGRSIRDTDVTPVIKEFNGLLDDVRIYNRALISSDIAELMAITADINNVPTNTQTTNEDTDLFFNSANGNLISINDPGLNNDNLQVTLTVDNGTLTLNPAMTGLDFTVGIGDSDTTMTFTGSLANINTALDGMKFTPADDYNGPASLQITTYDDTSLVGAYSFDDLSNLGADDSPGSAEDGTVSGAVTINDATRGDVLSFDGVDDGVTVQSRYGQPADVTLSAWINLTGTTRGEIISLGNSVILRAGLTGDAPGLAGAFYDGTTPYEQISVSTTLTNTGWHHVAYTMNDATNVQRLYLDGIQVASGTKTTSINYSKDTITTIGKHPGDTFYFDGLIDDARVYNRALTAQEIADIMNVPPGKDSDTIDITVNAVDDAPTDLITSGSLNLDGTWGGITVPTLSLDNRTDFTVEIEINPANIVVGGWSYALVMQTDYWETNGFYLDINDGKLDYSQYDDSKTPAWQGSAESSGGELTVDTWQTVTLTRDASGTIVIYLDGIQVASITGMPPIVDSTATLTFLDNFDGDVGEIRVLDRALTSTEVAASLNTNYVGNESGLLLLYKLEDETGNTVSDLPTGNHDGTVENPDGATWMIKDSVVENSTEGTVVAILSSTDPDPGDTFTYSIINDLSSNFEIIGREIQVKTGATLDYEVASSHIITIRVTDSDGLTYDEDVTIQVTKINEVPSFVAGDGIVTTSIGTGDDWARAMVLQDDGKAIVAGYASNGSNDDFALVRYNVDGSLDITFGTGGKVITTFGSDNDQAYAVTIQNDGKILVAGHSLIAGSLDFAVARYNIDGSLDTSFSTDGKVTVDFSSSIDYAESITVQTDGKILIAGMAGNEYAVIRLESDGTLDSSFGLAGKVTTDVDTGTDHAYALAVQTNGMIVLAGSSNSNFAIVRYDANGNLDAGFGTSGKVTTDFASSLDIAKSLIIQSDGKILVGGYANNGSNLDFALARYYANGSLDTSFSGDGKLLTDISNTDISQSMTQQADGKVILAGYDGTNTLTMIRYDTNGDIDTTFGTAGIIKQTVGSSMSGEQVAIRADGRIIVAGSSTQSNKDFAILSFQSDGSLDSRFDLVNQVTTLDGTPTFTEDGPAVVLDTDVEIFDAELATLNSGNGNYSGASLTLVRNSSASSDDVFAFNDGNSITLSGSNLIKNSQIIATFDITTTLGKLVITFTDANGEIPSSADVNNILRQVTYANSSDTPPASSVQIDWNFDDGNTGLQGNGISLQATGSTTVTITAFNDSPKNITPDIQSTPPFDNEVVFSSANGNLIAISDVDAGTNTVEVTLEVINGTLTLSSIPSIPPVSNLTFSTGDGADDPTMTFTGTISNINLALDGMTFTSDTGFQGVATIKLLTNDLGNTGGASAIDKDVITILVDTTTSFQQGVSLYTGTTDTEIRENSPDSTGGTLTEMSVDLENDGSNSTSEVLLKFDSIFGSNPGQIPVGATIISADLVLTVTSRTGSGDTISLHQMLAAWNENSTWNTFDDNGIQANDIDAKAIADSTVSLPDYQGPVAFNNLAATLQAWLDGSSTNNGWFIQTDSIDGWDIKAKDSSSTFERPLLSVVYAMPPQIDLDNSGAGSGYSASWVEDAGAVSLANSDATVVSDLGSSSLQSMTVTITNLLDGAAESLSVDTTDTSIVASYDTATGILTLTGPDFDTNFAHILDRVTYNNTSLEPDATARIITFVADDGLNLSNSATTTLNVTLVNDAPVLDGSGAMTLTSITEDNTNNNGNTVTQIMASAGGNRITDVDVGALEGIAIIVNNEGASGSWQYSVDTGSNWNAVGTVSDSSALLLRNTDLLRYLPDGDNGASPTPNIGFRAWDQTTGTAGNKINIPGVGGSNAFSSSTESALITVTDVNDAPVLDLDANDSSGSSGANYATSYTEGATAVDIVDSDAVLTDVDNTNLSSLTITLTNALDGVDDQFSWNSSGTTISGVQNWDIGAGTVVLTLTGTVSDTVTDYLQVLQTITYQTTSQSPDTTDRNITIIANDGSVDSNIGITTVTVTAVNDAPVAQNDPGGVYSESILDLNPLSYWRLGESSGTTAVDLGSAGNNGTYQGTTLGTTGSLVNDTNTSVDFSGAGRYVDVGSFNIAGTGLTLMGWINPDDFEESESRIISKANRHGSSQHNWMLSTIKSGDEYHLRFRLKAGGTTETLAASSGALSAGQWQLATATYDEATGKMAIYLNGKEVGSMIHTVGGAITNSANNVYIGANPDDVYRPFDGLIDEVAIFENALSATQIEMLYSQGVGSYSLNEDTTISVTAAEGVLANDSDFDGDTLTATLVSGPTHHDGVFVLNADGSFNYTPTTDFNGVDSFTYRTSDGSAESEIATVMINVAAVNDAPTITKEAIFTDSGQSIGSSNTLATEIGDIDGDGDLDLLAINYNIQANKIFLNDGNGNYSDSDQILGDSNTADIALGDIDGDGDLDLIIADTSLLGDKVLLNDGHGIFSDSGQNLGTSSSTNVALSDLDNDGDLDMVIDDKLYFNDGSGTFTDSGQSLGSYVTVSIALADIDDDGDIDFIRGNRFAQNKVYLNDGHGVFADSGNDFGINSNVLLDIALGDIDNDGDLDLIEANVNAANKVYINNGTGIFSDSGQDFGSAYSTSIALGDIDHDGDLDIAFGNKSQPNTIYINNGSGNYTSGQILGTLASQSVHLADVDIDGDLDLVVGNDLAQSNQVYFNDSEIDSFTTFTLTEGDPALTIINTGIIGDIDSTDFDGGILAISYSVAGDASDQLSIRHQGTATGQIGFDGSNVTYESTTIGTLNVTSDGVNGNTLAIDLNTNATPEAVTALLNNITFQNTSNNPVASRTLSITVNDGDGATSTAVSQIITIAAINDAPALEINSGLALNEGASGTITNTLLKEGDPDDSGTGSIYTITTPAVNGTLYLNATALGLNDTFTQDDIDNNLITYTHNGTTTTGDNFIFTLSDGNENGVSPLAGQTFTITVTPVVSTITWDGGGSTSNWSEAANWLGDIVPDANDVVIFDATSTKASVIDAGFAGTVGGVALNSGYSGTLSLGRGLAIEGDFTQNSGIFDALSQSLDINGDISLTTGTLRTSTATTTIEGNLLVTGGTLTGRGTVEFDGTTDQTLNTTGQALESLSIDKASGVLTITDTLVINGNLTHTAGSVEASTSQITFDGNTVAVINSGTMTFGDVLIDKGSWNMDITNTMDVDGTLTIQSVGSINNGTIAVAGDVYTADTSLSGTTTILFDGNADQIMDSTAASGTGQLTSVSINKLSGTLTIQDDIAVTGNWTYTAGIVDSSNSLVAFVGNSTVTINSGDMFFENVSFDKKVHNLNISGTMDIEGDLTIQSVGHLNNGTISVARDVYTAETNLSGTTIILFDGNTDQTVNSTAASGTGQLTSISINKPSGTLIIQDDISIVGNWTYTAGTVDISTSLITFAGNNSVAIDSGVMAFGDVSIDKGPWNISVLNTMDIDGDLTIQSVGAMFNGTVAVAGDVFTADTSFTGSTIIQFDGAADQVLASTALSGTGQLTSISINKSSGTLTIQDDIGVSGNWDYTTGTVDASNSTIFFLGNGSAIISSGAMTFGNVTFDKGSYNLSVSGTMNIEADLAIQSVWAINNGTITVKGNIISSDSSVIGTTALRLNGTNLQTISGSDLPDGDITINKASGWVVLADDLILKGTGQDLHVLSGTLDLAGYSIDVTDDSVNLQGGTIQANGSIIGDLNVNSGGTLAFDINGVNAAEFDTLTISGTLTADAADSHLRFDLLDLASSGTASGILSPGILAGSFTDTTYQNNTKSYITTEQYDINDTLSVFFNTIPVISGGDTDSISVTENTLSVTAIDATDADGDTLAYSIDTTIPGVGVDGALFDINPATGALTFKTAPDFEVPSDNDGDNVYQVIVKTIDPHGESDSQTISITVTDIVATLTVDTNADNNDSIITDGNASHTIEWLNVHKGADNAISLREAIIAANNTNGTDTISFDIAGPHTIDIASALPNITDTIVIDGTSEPNFAGNPIIELNGATAGAVNGLVLSTGSDGSTIRGLIINRFGDNGVVLNSNNNVLAGNYIGTDASGAIDLGNADDGVEITGDNNLIGGLTDADRNIISGNDDEGIAIKSSASGTIVRGNYIGTNSTGDTKLGNAGNGIKIDGANNTIGGAASGAGNIMSGNIMNGISIQGASATSNTVQGNYIGTNASGTLSLDNTLNGISISLNSNNNIIGTDLNGADDAQEGNLISGNTLNGINISGIGVDENSIRGNKIGVNVSGDNVLGNLKHGISINAGSFNLIGGASTNAANLIGGNNIGISLSSSSNNKIQGNYIGTDIAGTTNLGNLTRGISIVGGSNNTIGTDLDGTNDTTEGNLISGNDQLGILLWGSTGNSIRGNKIGVDASATTTLQNGAIGIQLSNNSSNNTIGGTTDNAANIIGGTSSTGIFIGDPGSTGNIVQGNYIGTDTSGTINLGSAVGLRLANGANGNLIGGTQAGAGNTIAFNQNHGIIIKDDTTINNALLGNRIYGHSDIAIDLADNGVTVNDLNDGDTGPNALQNFPILSSATTNGTNIIISGSLNSEASTEYRIEFFASSTADGTGYGEGERYLGSINVGTNASGFTSFNNIVFTATIAEGEFISATATRMETILGVDKFYDTSEFALNVVAASPGITVTPVSGLITTEAGGTATFDVVLDAAPTTDVTINLSVDDATEGSISSSSLIFTASNWNIAQSVTVTGLQDFINDGNTAFSVITAAATSTDTNYAGINASDVSVTNNEVTNTAPVNTVPGTQTILEETQTAIPGISITDIDAGTSIISTQLTVSNGILDVTLSGNATISAGLKNSSTLTISGHITDINATLSSLVYTGDTNIIGINADTLTILTDDNGNSGTGGPFTDSDTVQIDITNINDAPTLTATSFNPIYTEGGSAVTVFSNVSADTIESGQTIEEFVFTVSNVTQGSYERINLDGSSFVLTDGTNGATSNHSYGYSVNLSGNTATVTITTPGTTTSDIKALVESLSYENSSEDPTTADRVFTITSIKDSGGTNNDGVDTINPALISTITITAVNDAPTATNLNTAEAYIEDITLNLTDLIVTDVDSDVTITLTLSGAAAGSLNIGTSNSVTSTFDGTTWIASGTVADVNTLLADLVFTPANNYNASFSITTHVTDGVNAALTGTKSFTGTPVNDEPSFTAPADQSVGYESGAHTVAGFVTPAAGGGSDENTQTFTYSVSNDNAILFSVAPTIDANGQLTYTVATGQIGTATVTVFVTDTGGVANSGDDTSASQTFDITVAANTAPTITAISNQTIDEDAATAALAFTVADAEAAAGTLTVTASSSDNTLMPDGNLVLANDGNGNWTIVATPLADQNGTVSITLTVNDGTTTTNETFDITVNAVNDDPGNTGSLPTDLSVTEDISTTLDLSAINLSDVDAATGTLTITLTTSTGGDLTAAAGTGITVGGSSTALTLTGTLGDLNTYLDNTSKVSYLHGTANINGNNADTIAVTINDNGNTGSGGGTNITLGTVNVDITAVNDEQSLDTNTGLLLNEGATATIDSSKLASSDLDNTATQLIYSVTTDPGNGHLELTTDIGTTINSFTQDDINNNRLLYIHDGSETSNDSFNFSVDDGAGASSTGTFNISVNLLNDNTPVVTTAQTFLVSELANNNFSLGTALATDIDTGTILSDWTITGGNTDGIFAINTSTGEITVSNNSNLDFDTTPSYTLSLTVSDGMNTSAVETVVITVTDVATVITANQSFSITETAPDASSVSSVVTTGDSPVSFTITGGNTGAAFAIDNSGNITVANTAAIDFETLTSYTLTIEVSDGTTLVSETVSISVTDVNESGIGTISDTDIAADSVAENAGIGDAVGITAFATDPDGTDTVTYSLSANPGNRFAIDPNTGEVAVNAALDAETATAHSITVTAISTDTSFSTQTYTIIITDINEVSVGPVTDSDSTANSVIENAAIGDTVGIIASASDTDVDDYITYTLSDDAGGLFMIDSTTGIVTIASALNVESTTTHNITVLATSHDTSTSTQIFSITVTAEDNTNETDPTTLFGGIPEEDDDEKTDEESTLSSTPETSTPAPIDLPVIQPHVENTPPRNNDASLPELSEYFPNQEDDDFERTVYKNNKHIPFDPQSITSSFQYFHSINMGPTPNLDLGLAMKNNTATSDALWKNIELVRSQIDLSDKVGRADSFKVEYVAGASISFTAGIVSWVLRGGSLIASFLSSVPVFRNFDPLPIATNSQKNTDDDEKDKTDHKQSSRKAVNSMFDGS